MVSLGAAATVSSGFQARHLLLDRIDPQSPHVRFCPHRYVAELLATPNEDVVNVARKGE